MTDTKPQKPDDQDHIPDISKGDGNNPPNETPTFTSRRLSLTNVRRQLTDDELANPGVQKLILDMLEEAESERDNNKVYITSYHEVDKKAAILGEKLLADKKVDVFFGLGVGLGGAILGLAPYFGQIKTMFGLICGFIGLALIVGSSIGRTIKK
jgi:hypothetical protein